MIQNFREYLRQTEKSPATVTKYCREAGLFLYFCKGEITKERAVAYKQNLLAQGVNARTLNGKINALNAFFTFRGLTDCRLKTVRVQQDLYRAQERELTKETYFRLLRTAEQQKNERTALILQTLCATGIRVSELPFITVEAVKRGEAIVDRKAKIRRIFLVPELCRKLLQYIRRHNIAGGSIFINERSRRPLSRVTIWRLLKSVCPPASVEKSKVFPHNFRHLFARLFYREGKDLAKLADVLGHASVSTTRIYLISTGEEHKKYMERLRLIS